MGKFQGSLSQEYMEKLFWLLILSVFLLFSVQSCSDSSTSSIQDKDDPIDLTKPLESLPGDDNENIINATFDFTYPSEITEELVSNEEIKGVNLNILRTEIEVTFQETATVHQINQLLDIYDAKIVDMLEGVNSAILLIPDPGNIDNLRSVIEQIESEDSVKFIVESSLVTDPDTEGTFDEALKIQEHITVNSRLSHHLAIRAHAAWNLKNAIKELDHRPWFVVADGFGGGVPGKGYNANFTNSDFGLLSTSYHGYHVLGIALGNHNKINELSDDQNDVVGIFPEKLNVRAHDLKTLKNMLFNTSWSRKMNKIIRLMREIRVENPNVKIVLNTSLGSRDDIKNNEQHAYNWIGKVRGANQQENLENTFIHFTGAGNLRNNEERYPAKEASLFALAGLEDVMINESLRRKLNNIFVVENFRWTLQDIEIRPLPNCPHWLSIMEGNISAIGSDVYSFGECLQRNSEGRCTSHKGDSNTSFADGTSMSTPQAAGLGAYVWAVNPNLSVSEVMEIIRGTAERIPTPINPAGTCSDIEANPVIDAYAAVLAAGGDNARIALLDVNEDGEFDENDIEIFLTEFEERNAELDYSRYDLNGSGKTGGNSTERFDLNNSMSYGNLTITIEETEVYFDETALTDEEILCYYAYSDLFNGDSSLRGELLNGICTESNGTDGNGDWPRDTTTEIVDVYNPATGQTWMDRNLGASRAATSMDDEEAYGDLYQWGRAADGHEKRNSGTTSTLSSTDTPGHGDFITSSSGTSWDWRSPQNDDLWQGVNGVNNPCPDGYRLPTEAEWEAERQSWGSNNRVGAVESPLKLPVAGYRSSSSGSLYDVGSLGLYWSSSVSGAYSRHLSFGSSSANVYSGSRAFGFSVRCLKN